jgi:sugar lactone lactonase YvrE
VSLLFPILLLLALPLNAGAQTAHFTYAQLALGGGFSGPSGVALDSSGNVYVADTLNSAVKKIPVGCISATCVTTLGSGFSGPRGIWVDGSENVFVADTGNNAIKEIVAAGGYTTINTLGSGFNHPQAIALDGSGNVYVADTGNNAVKVIVTPVYTTVNTIGSGFKSPAGVAVDTNFNVFVADTGNNVVEELLAVGGYTTVNTLGGGFSGPSGIWLGGNLYVADSLNNAVKVMPLGCASASCVQTLASDFNTPTGVAVDGSGNLYVADQDNNRVVEQFANTANFGTVAAGQTYGPISLTFTFDTGGTIGAPIALTQGAPGLDFAVAGSGTCTSGSSFSAGDTCTVNVTFTPKFAGARYGAAELTDNSGNVIATAYLQGTGSGPQVSFLPYTQSTLGGGFGLPNSLAVDGYGNVFVADYTNQVKEIPVGCSSSSCVKIVGSGFDQAAGVALDGAGNLFVADTYHSAVKEVLAAGGYTTVKTLSTDFATPTGIAVDASGNVFIADPGTFVGKDQFINSTVKEIVAAGGYTTVNTLAGSYNAPNSVAVDASGNLFVADTNNNLVKELPAANGYTMVNPVASGFNGPMSVALDGSGNLFVADFDNAALKEVLADSGYIVVKTLVTYSAIPAAAVTVDAGGNVYVGIQNTTTGGVFKLDYADPPSMVFATTTSVGTTDTNDGLQTVTLQNIGNAVLDLAGVTLPEANFTVDSSTTCSVPLNLDAGTSCDVGIWFAPAAPGTLTGNMTFTDNALNVTGATQQVNLSGKAEAAAAPPAPVIDTGPPNPSGATTATFTFSDTQAGVTFVCQLDTAASAPCTSGITYSALAAGAHTFAVKAADAQGNLSPAATYTWNVTPVPAPSIDGAPGNPTTATSATFNFSDTQAGVTFVCSLDFAGYAACTSPASYSSLAGGAHTFAVEAKNSQGVLSPAATYNWTISTAISLAGAVVGFGTLPVGQTSAAVALNYTFSGSVTLGSVVALTGGAPNLDFAIASGTTCTVGSYSSGNSCVVNVTFTPKFAGYRKGAVLLEDNSGNTVAMSYVSGTGSGSQARLLSGNADAPSSETTIGGGFNQESGLAVDGAGNVYVADFQNSAVKMIPPGCTSASCVQTLGGGFNQPRGVAVDGAGNVFVADWGNNVVKEMPPGCTSAGCVQTIGGGFLGPYGVAVDGAGNVFVADLGNNAVKEILAAGGYTTVNTLGSGFLQPEGVAVDGSGNVFVVETGINPSTTGCTSATCATTSTSLMEITAASNYSTVTTLANDFNAPLFVAVDGSGNVYISEVLSPFGEVLEYFAAGGYTRNLPLNLNCGSETVSCDRTGVAVDGNGNIYVASPDNNTVLKMDYVDAPSMAFATPTVAGTRDTTDSIQYVSVVNDGNAPLSISAITPSTNFGVATNANSCSTSAAVAAGTWCLVGAYFAPTTSGALTGNVTITDNNLNASSATQQMNLSGVGVPPAPTITSYPSSPTTATAATFQFTDTAAGVTFLCSLDGAAYTACTSGVSYSSLALATHTFGVKAVDGSGNTSPASTYTWIVGTAPPPAPTITSEPSNISTSTSATFTFTDTELGVTFYCMLNDNYASLTTCTSPTTYSSLTNVSTNTFTVFAVDAADNISPWTNYTWTISTTPQPTNTSGAFGTVAIGQTAGPISLTFSFNSNGSGTIGSITALTQGAPGLDFALANGGTCATGMTYTAQTTCTARVTFTPTLAGLRTGAVVVNDSSGNILALGYVHGIGSGPQVSFLPYKQSTIGSGFDVPRSVGVDGAGNVYVVDNSSTQVTEFPAGCTTMGCVKMLGGTLGATSFPTDIAIDGAGNIFVAGDGTTVVYEIPPGCATASCVMALGSGFYDYWGVAVDGSGNVFVADSTNNAVKEVLAAGGYTTINTLGGGFSEPLAVAVDASGNVFVSDFGNNALKVMPPGCTSASCVVTLPRGPLVWAPWSMALDGMGNLFAGGLATATSSDVIELTVASDYATVNTLIKGLNTPGGVVVDGLGNVYVADTGANQFYKFDYADPPALAFATPTAPGSTDTTDGTLTATVQNIGNAVLTFSGIAVSANFKLDNSVTTCSTSTALAAGTSCVVGVTFAPTISGALAGTLTLTDNALNVSGATQVINLAGTATGSIAPPLAPTINSGPANPTTATTATFTFSDTQSGVTFVCSLDSAAYAACSSGVNYSALAARAHTFAVEAKGSAGNLSTAATYNWTVIAPPPPPIITSEPAASTDATAATFNFSDTQAGVTFVCSLDSAAYAACTSGVSYSSLAVGAHTFAVEAKDSLGDLSTAASYNWSVTTWPPAPTITSGPANTTTSTSATFTFIDTQSDLTFVCSLDSAAYAACSSGISYSSLAASAHTFAVEAKDTYGNLSSAATYNWTIITPPPAPSINSGPAKTTTATTATFTFSDTQSGVTFQCSLDSAAYAACSSGISYSSLAVAAHTFAVEAKDTYGNLSSAATYNWTIITPPPAPAINSGPANPTTSTSATFTFSDTQSGVTFQCSLDSAAYAACSSGISYSSLATGAHTFAVEAKDTYGNLGSAATYNWTIITPPPAPTINSGPAKTTTATTATFTFSDSQSGVTFVCSLDSAAYAACSSGISYSSLAIAAHTFAVEAKDTYGNLSSATTYNWTVSAAPPISASLLPTPLVFAPQDGGTTSAPQTLTLTNYLSSSLSLSASLGGANPGDFTVQGSSTCPYPSGQLKANSSCTYHITFKPSLNGAESARLSVNDADGTQTATLSGTGIGAALAPTTLTFAAQKVGTTSAEKSITLTNYLRSSLSVSATLGGANPGDFAVQKCGSCPYPSGQLKANSSCTYHITFKPSLNGAESATLSVTDADGTQTATLSGTGIGAALAPTTLTFAAQKVGTTSAEKSITLTNYLRSSLSVSVTLGGANPGDFAVQKCGSCPYPSGQLKANSSCTYHITFKPSLTGAASATLSVSDADGTQTATLSGTGVK